MRSFLLDTDVVSALRLSDRLEPSVRRSIEQLPKERCFVSVITVMEIEIGVRRIERRDREQAVRLRRWMTETFDRLSPERILPFDHEMAILCASLNVPDRRSHNDSMIAATALARDLTIVTRNVADFVRTGVSLLDPWNI